MPTLGCHATYQPSATAEELGLEFCAEIDDVFRRADIVSLHTALKPETRKLVNAERIAMMKPGAILITTARGEIVDQAALLGKKHSTPNSHSAILNYAIN